MSSEPVVLPYTIRRSAAAMAAPLGGSEVYRADAVLEYVPWRGIFLTVTFGAIWAIALFSFAWSFLEHAWPLVLLAGLIASVSEVSHRTDLLTECGIERRAGILGGRRIVIPYDEIESVDVDDAPGGSDVGTITVHASAQHLRLVAIIAPYEVAAIIAERQRASRADTHHSPANSLGRQRS